MSDRNLFQPIRAFLFDVDGVFTDGSLLALESGEQARVFNIKDGLAVVKALQAGYHIGVISGGTHEGVRRRLSGLGIQHIYLKVDDKLAVFHELVRQLGLGPQEVVYMGDDLPDYPVMSRDDVVAACPADAVEEIRQISQYVASRPGGHGAVREVIERVMKTQQTWTVP
ncbi:3-deoxy-D-manno-octulosonate 8-phosphate phosphatase (KDO 8-P phosphatase) [Catalinimonas alkaloidigena]|uniref:3-deoxy-D-manno-octulosonate 8-phosphate phosphatase (KDO 8-P phosphatase) n=1 Tax=Catalinimonas alkaloidigena TaxID=1075417 RepID=A0A1G9MZW0_9BACT|nr:HAD hydrolase-like protein [Catalinimonas alkaloidigena]SDL79427.1 3-deoxy-D-manno-octulosonate 8-phosphate phosphatase (KDO 8-P phosphatase) [Catalinimonas alkaloidigena]